MKRILFLLIFISNSGLYGINYETNLNKEQTIIIKKIILNESFLDKNRYNNFWENSTFKKNSMITNSLLVEYNKIYELKLELWRSAKLSYKYLDIIKTDALEKLYHKLNTTDKENIFNILLAAKIHDDVNMINNKKVHFNLLFIENMLQKQKNILITLNQLLNKDYNCNFYLSELYSDFTTINVCPTIGYEYFSGGLFKKYIFRENNTMVSFNFIEKKINLNTCLNIIANNFYLNDLLDKEKEKNSFFREIEKDKFLFGKCVPNNDGTLMFYLYGKKIDINKTINIMKK